MSAAAVAPTCATTAADCALLLSTTADVTLVRSITADKRLRTEYYDDLGEALRQ